jgi:4-hydroxy-tetrahydrodipicolinate synthase
MFSGLSAFPLSPMNEEGIDEAAFVRLVERLAAAKVDSIGALGSTGSYAYLTRNERFRLAQLAVQHAGGIPVMVGIGALRTRDVLYLTEDAQRAGASAVLLAPVSYQALADDEVYELYADVSRKLSVPMCVYDNPRTTRFEFSDQLHGRIAALPQVGSIKIPTMPGDPEAVKLRVQRLRAVIPPRVTIGISGDASAVVGLSAGCEAWYSVLGGLFPKTALAITRAARSGKVEEADRLSDRLEPLWEMFRSKGSIRVMATAAELRGLVSRPSLPLPLRELEGIEREGLGSLLANLELTE